MKQIIMITKIEEKRCPVCGGKIIGRSDKKFCNDKCRTCFHNEKYRAKKMKYKELKSKIFFNYKLTKSVNAIIEKFSIFGK